MMPYENITQASTHSGRPQSVTHKKRNTIESNANPILQCLQRLLKMLAFHLCIRKNNNETKTGEKRNSISSNKR